MALPLSTKAQVIELEQYGTTKNVTLSRSQRTALRASKPRLVDVLETDEELFNLKASNHIGTAIAEDLRILVRPRFELSNVFFMLGYAERLARWGEQSFPYSYEKDFFRALVWFFEAEIRRAIKYGLQRDYERREEVLPTLRGRPDAGAQIRELQGRIYPIACRYHEFLEDIPLNRVLKAALHRVRRLPGLEPNLALRLRHHQRSFAEVSTEEFHPARVPDFDFNRLNDHWKSATVLAQLILRQQTLVDHTGAVVGITFIVDMNKVFERFVEAIVKAAARRRGFQAEGQQKRPLTDHVEMIPDLIIHRDGQDLAVADVKYKALDPVEENWAHPDLYQLLAYCTALELPRGLLIYAEADDYSAQKVRGADITLVIEEIPLSGTPSNVLSRAERVADVLLDQAVAQLPASLSSAA
jgi:5-methylcytosine-specific restriction enzyme subunit McrC